MILGIDIFLAISLLTCLLDRHLPAAIPYIYQIAAVMGFAHLLVSREFMLVFGDQMRFWYSIIYLIVSLANVVAGNFYLGVSKGLWSLARIFLGTVTVPAVLVFSFFVSGYMTLTTPAQSFFPRVPLTFLHVALIVSAGLLGGSIFASYKLGMRSVEKEVKR